MNKKYKFNMKRQNWLVCTCKPYKDQLDDDREAFTACLDLMASDRPEHMIDVIIPCLHQYALDYARIYDLRSSHEFLMDFYKTLCQEIRDYSHFLQIREESRKEDLNG